MKKSIKNRRVAYRYYKNNSTVDLIGTLQMGHFLLPMLTICLRHPPHNTWPHGEHAIFFFCSMHIGHIILSSNCLCCVFIFSNCFILCCFTCVSCHRVSSNCSILFIPVRKEKSKREERDGVKREGVGFNVVSNGGNGVGGIITFDYNGVGCLFCC